MKNLKYLTLIGIIVLYSGCTTTEITKKVNPVTMEQKVIKDKSNIFDRDLMKKYSKFKIRIRKGDELSEVLQEYNDKNPFGFIIVNNVKSKVIFDYPYEFRTLNDFAEYVKATTNIRLNIKRFNDKIFQVDEIMKDENMFKENYLVDVSTLDFTDQPIFWKGSMNEKDIIDMIQQDFNIPVILKDNEVVGSVTITSNTNTKTTTSTSKKSNKIENKLIKILENRYIDNYKGTIKKLIQRIAIENKLFIKFQQGIVVLSSVDTKIFKLKMPYLDLATEEMFKDLTSLKIQPYEDLKEQLKAVLGEDATLNINKSSGDILITGNYDELREAQIIIQNFHNMYKKTIHLDVYVYEVNLDKSNKFGVSFDTQYLNTYLNGTGTGTFSYNTDILTKTINPNLSTFTYTRDFATTETTAEFNKFFLNFLNQFGNAKILTKPKLSTINGIPVYMKIIQKKDYISEVEETINNDTNNNTTTTISSSNVKKDTITTGFTLGIYPIAEKDGKIKLILRPVISQLLGLDEYKYGSEDNPKTIQLLNISEKDFSQTINLKDGEIAIISGYMYEKNQANKNTLPFMDATEDNILDPLVSTKQKDISKVEMVIAIKASISY